MAAIAKLIHEAKAEIERLGEPEKTIPASPTAPNASAPHLPKLLYGDEYLRAVRAKTIRAVSDAEEADEPTHERLAKNMRDLFADEDYQRIAVSFLVHQIRLLPDPIERVGIDTMYELAQRALVDTFDYLINIIED